MTRLDAVVNRWMRVSRAAAVVPDMVYWSMATSETGTAGCRQLCSDSGDAGILDGVQGVHSQITGPVNSNG